MRREQRSLPGTGLAVQRGWSRERENADLRGRSEDGVNHFSLYEMAIEHLSISSVLYSHCTGELDKF